MNFTSGVQKKNKVSQLSLLGRLRFLTALRRLLMKKKILSLLLLGASMLPLSAYDLGLSFDAGVDTSIINLYTYQNVTFKIQSDGRIGAEAGVRVLENYSFVPHFYFNPFVQFDLRYWYIGGGLMFPSDMSSSDDLLWFVRSGFLIGNWGIGPGKGSIDLGA